MIGNLLMLLFIDIMDNINYMINALSKVIHRIGHATAIVKTSVFHRMHIINAIIIMHIINAIINIITIMSIIDS